MKKQPLDFGYKTWFSMYRNLVENDVIDVNTKTKNIHYRHDDNYNLAEHKISVKTLKALCFAELEMALLNFSTADAMRLKYIVYNFSMQNNGSVDALFLKKVEEICDKL